MLRHLVFADCSAMCDNDPFLRHTFMAMAYGLYPFCVTEDPEGTHLLFRRVAIPGDSKDKVRRMTDAVEALNALPAVRRYHASLPDHNRELHVQPGSYAVAWPIHGPEPAVHIDVVPDLLRWTHWDTTEPWACLLDQVCAGGTTSAADHVPYANQPRHLKMAMVADFVGNRMTPEGAADIPGSVVHACRRALHLASLNQLQVSLDPDTGAIRDVQGYQS